MRSLFVMAGGLILIAVVVMSVSMMRNNSSKDTDDELVVSPAPAEIVAEELIPQNLSYRVAGRDVTLVDGISRSPSAPGSAAETITGYFGNELRVDLNGDAKDDVVFFITEETGGTGLFYYIVAAVSTPTGYEGTEAVFVGDRIAPQSISKGDNGTIVVAYADRAPGEPFTVSPSVGKSLVLVLDPGTKQFGQVMIDFEGEANPEVMSLTMKTWEWKTASYNDGREISPRQAGVFTLTFNDDTSFGVTTDCNGGGGSYTASADTITFSNMVSTLMYCEDSQEQVFYELLGTVSGYHFTSRGELILDLKFDSGSMVFN